MLLTKLRDTAQAHLGPSKVVRKVVITVPASFTTAQRQATNDAAAICGLEVLRLVSDASAAALAYCFQTTHLAGTPPLVHAPSIPQCSSNERQHVLACRLTAHCVAAAQHLGVLPSSHVQACC
jgi:hypothetical protein